MSTFAYKMIAFAAAGTMAAAAAHAQQATLILATVTPPDSHSTRELYRPWAQRVEAASGGALKIDIREGEVIANLMNAPDRLDEDVVQLHRGRSGEPSREVSADRDRGLPLLAKNGESASVALWRLYKTGLLDAEFKNYVPLWFHTYGSSGLHFAKAPTTLEDLRGLKMSISNKIQSDIIADLGGAPMFFSPPDVYEAINRGNVNGMITSWNTFGPWKYAEVTTYHVEVAFSTPSSIFMMTRKRYDALPRRRARRLLRFRARKCRVARAAPTSMKIKSNTTPLRRQKARPSSCSTRSWIGSGARRPPHRRCLGKELSRGREDTQHLSRVDSRGRIGPLGRGRI